MSVQVLVLAKAPVTGRVKTRLCPPLTLEGAARSTRVMSAIARTVPVTVPVTLDRPPSWRGA